MIVRFLRAEITVGAWIRRVFMRSEREGDGMVKFCYIGNTRDIEKFETIAGKIERAPNWEATRLGLHVEVELTSYQVHQLGELDSVTVFDEKQHILSDDDIRMHKVTGWSKAGMIHLERERSKLDRR